ncbi:alpha-amylase family glycosyl hydrolase [Roseivivax isoporae]|uniref:Alpha-glucosidase n=1 Tax=Roseivivax isoporae LMG 25204 TaxID=1449351 RepID=X7F309_9RHOB|nr:alpha-amylase family glycosyl hydrolase [Roseivivax isoporae]ETX27180.1 alpha-glucosidase [Roseivivax isoporae LMG 25204]
MARDEWWRGAVTYQIYPRSFQDDDGDGMGDLRGITRRLGHVADLGVDAIWLSPVFTSPMADMGYDVSDHRDIDPSFGTLADFDALVDEAHRLGLKVIIDQVLSHSSDRHPFFTQSRASRDNPKADWYVWHDPKVDGTPPNNWQAIFGGPAWTWDVRRKQYYFHQFLPQQPDLNFHNPEVRAWVLETLRFWLERGVDGFRLDAVNHFFHDAELRDNPPDWREKTEPDYKTFEMQFPKYSKNRPENLPFMEEMRRVLDGYEGRVFIGEIGEAHHPAERLAEYTAAGRLHMAYNSELMGTRFSAAHVRRQIDRLFTETPESWPCWAFSNHDVPRHVSRWATYGTDQDALARMCGTLLLSLEGSVCLYQGEELGLGQADLAYEELVDPEGLNFWPDNKGRDGCRTPMVWEDGPHGGFSAAEVTWLPVKPPHLTRTVASQQGQAASVLETYRAMVALRKAAPELRTGRTTFLDTDEPVLMFRRGEGHLCVFNLGPAATEVALPGALAADLAVNGAEVADGMARLPGNGALVGRLA